MRVLGIDPGLRLTGYACLEHGSGSGVPRVVEAGVLRFSERRSVADRLVELERDLDGLLARAGASVVCVEALYAHYGHPRTAITMAHARGVILLASRRAGLELMEIPAAQAKKSVTGNGQAGKKQMQSAVRAVLGLAEEPEPADVADAMAIALTGLRRLTAGAVV